MQNGKKYVNITPGTTYGIKLIKIQYFDEKRMKIKYMFINKLTGDLVDLITYKGRILRENIKDWVEFNER